MGDKKCTSCAKAGKTCPSFPSPVGECKQYEKHPEARRWWDSVNPRKDNISGD